MHRRSASLRFITLVSAVVAALAAVTAAGESVVHIQGSGVVIAQSRSVSGFHAIAVDVPAEVTLSQGNTEGLTLLTDDNVAPMVETVVENGTLKIRWARRNFSVNVKRLDIVIAAKAIDSLAVRASADVRAPSLKTNALSIAVDGSAELAIAALDVNSLKVAVRGDGQLTAAGRADTLDVAMSGSGELHASKLESQRARLALNGSAQATVWAKEELAATIAGSSEITYYGKPRVTHTIVGSGRIAAAAGTS